MKEFYVNIGGANRRIRYTAHDGRTIKDQLGRTIGQAFVPGDMEFAAVLLSVGLARGGDPTMTREVLLGTAEKEGIFDEYIAGGGDLWDLVRTAMEAATYAGLVAWRRIEVEPGKAPAASAGPEPAIPAAS